MPGNLCCPAYFMLERDVEVSYPLLGLTAEGNSTPASRFVKPFIPPSKMVYDPARDGTDFLLYQVELGKVGGWAMVIRSF